MAFVVDGSDWKLNGKSATQVEAAIEQFLGALGDANDAEIPVWFSENFQADPVLGNQIIWELMGPGSPLQLPTELWQELAAYLGRPRHYIEDERQPQGFPIHFDIAIDGGMPEPNPDVAWAHHSVREGRAVACIGLWRTGVFRGSSQKTENKAR